MILSLVAGGLVGAGLLVLVQVFSTPAPGVAATLARIDRGRSSDRSLTTTAATASGRGRLDLVRERIGVRAESEVGQRGWTMERTRTDLAIMNRSMAQHLGNKVLLAIAAFGWFPAVLWLTGFADGYAVPVGAALVAGAFGFVLPDLSLRREAEARRKDFRHVTGAFLDLVAMNLAGGRGLPEALMAASSFGNHWAMVQLRQALSNARIMGWTPWEGIARLGRELGVEELRDLASALALAGDEGARIRSSLSARAESMRRKELVDVEGAAGENSQSMLVAQLLMCIAFLVFLAYPAVSQLG